jgi:ribosome-interacting GTPase 1
VPANLSPEYKAADAAFRKARDPVERLECLREMLRTIPKHKGTEKLQADIKARIKSLSDEFEGGARKGGGHGGPALVIRPEGAAQVALLGPPNSGKSSLHARLTGSEAHVAPYAFTTQYPQPGMMAFEDVHLQLVDLPAISSEHPVPWLGATLQMADAALLVMDLGDADCVDELAQVESILRERGVTLVERWEHADTPADDDPFAVRLPALLLANKSDLLASADEEIEAFRELSGERFPVLKVSATTGEGLDELGRWLFDHLGIVRVYTKAPGHAFEKTRPFTLRRGQTVSDVARLVHKDIERAFRYARVWGGHSEFEGQQVGPQHAVSDGDIVELHT